MLARNTACTMLQYSAAGVASADLISALDHQVAELVGRKVLISRRILKTRPGSRLVPVVAVRSGDSLGTFCVLFFLLSRILPSEVSGPGLRHHSAEDDPVLRGLP